MVHGVDMVHGTWSRNDMVAMKTGSLAAAGEAGLIWSSAKKAHGER